VVKSSTTATERSTISISIRWITIQSGVADRGQLSEITEESDVEAS
jgi:hypothetical protein